MGRMVPGPKPWWSEVTDMTKRNDNETDVKVVGCHENGTRFWYTGRAGEAFVSTDPTEAFRFESVEIARRKALALNRDLPVHAIYFVACVGDLA